MADSNKVIIKINYQGADKKLIKQLRPERVTEWNVQRILFALILLVVFILAPIYYFNTGSSVSEKTEVLSEKYNDKTVGPDVKLSAKAVEKKPLITDVKYIENIGVVKKPDVKLSEKTFEKVSPVTDIKSIDNIKEVIKEDAELSTNTVEKEPLITDIKPVNNIKTEGKSVAEGKVSFKVFSNAKVARAMLTTGLSNKEPLASISLPVVVNKKNAVAVYYFTEILNMNGEVLYHHWLYDGISVYKKKINILGNRWRASTSKLIPYSKVGRWHVRLVSKDNIILNEIKFNVIQEQ